MCGVVEFLVFQIEPKEMALYSSINKIVIAKESQ